MKEFDVSHTILYFLWLYVNDLNKSLKNILVSLQRCLDTLSQDDVEVRRRLAEQTRKITVLQINEKALTRRYNTLVEVEGTMRKVSSKGKLILSKSINLCMVLDKRYKH